MKKLTVDNGEFSKYAWLGEAALLAAPAFAFSSLHPVGKVLASLPMAKGLYDAATQDTEEEDGVYRGERITKGLGGTAGLALGLAGKAALGGMGGGSYTRTKLRGT